MLLQKLATPLQIQVLQSSLTENVAYCLKPALSMTKVGLVCPAGIVLQTMASCLSAHAWYHGVTASLPQDPELPLQWKMVLVMHWQQALPCTLAHNS